MKKHLLLLKLASANQFIKIRDSLKTGQMVLHFPDRLPEGSQVQLKLFVSSGQDGVLIDGIVSSHQPEKIDQSDVLVIFSGDLKIILSKIEEFVSAGNQFNKIESKEINRQKIPPKSDAHSYQSPIVKTEKKEPSGRLTIINETGTGSLSFDDIKGIVSSQEYEINLKADKAESTKIIHEKKELTPEERQMAEPVAKFILNLTKAMLRSGYYDPDHPSSKTAKKGLYEEFLRVAGEFNEIAFTTQKKGDDTDIFITGILDNQVNVRTLVGSGMAELFVPKLSEYCDRKQLMSFAIKKKITGNHFNQFIDIMSDPKVDRDDFAQKGAYLTNSLIESGITEISTVFYDDIINFEIDLPWRVQMAMQRLAKDLKIIPMFKGVSEESIRKIKIQTVQDIIRPLNHPKYFNDFLVNSYIIAHKIADMKPEDIENIIVEAFPIHFLLPTSSYTFQELEHVEQLKAEQPHNPSITRRLIGIRRILKMIASRVSIEKAPGAFSFLEQLYRNNILAFKELPVEAQYLVNTRNMTVDIMANFNKYRDALLKVRSTDDALVYLKCFRRILPMMIDENNWEAVRDMAALVNQASSLDVMSSAMLIDALKIRKNELKMASSEPDDDHTLTNIEKILAYVFLDLSSALISAYENTDRSQHPVLEEILDNFGSLGVDILSRVLAKSDDKETRKMCVASLVSKGELSRKWALNVLAKPNIAWYLHRNALMILREVSKNPEDFDKIRGHLGHENSKIREEMISLIVSMRPEDAESLIISALDDIDVKVRWRSARALADVSPISESSVNDILNIIAKPLSEDKEAAADQMKKIMNLISAISGLPDIPNKNKIEITIISALNAMIGQEKGLMKLFRRVVGSENEISLLKTAIPLLGRIGGQDSVVFFKKLMKSHSQLSDLIQKSINSILQGIK
jgi:hypothetical protein